LFSICWTSVYSSSAAMTAQARRRRQQDRGHRRDDRADDRHKLEDARDDRQEHGVATEDRVDQLAQDEQPDEGEDPDDDPEDELAPHPLAEIVLDGLDDRPRVEPPGRGSEWSNCPTSVTLSLTR
jgi:hypothetical protein